jgi:WD40 repeat protein
VSSLTFACEQLLQSAATDAVRGWDIERNRHVGSMPRAEQTPYITWVVLAGGTKLTRLEDGNITMYRNDGSSWRTKVNCLTGVTSTPDASLVLVTIGKLPHNSDPESKHILLLDGATGKRLPPLDTDIEHATAAAISPDGKVAAIVAGDPPPDPGSPAARALQRADDWVEIWDVPARKRIATIEDARGTLRSPTFSPDGKWLAAAGADAFVWDVASQQRVASLQSGNFHASAVAFSPNGRWLATGSVDSTVQLWDTATWESRASFTGDDPSREVAALAFSPDGRTLAAARGHEIILFTIPRIPVKAPATQAGGAR